MVLRLVALSLYVCLGGGVPAQDPKPQAPEQEAIMKKWMEFMTPGAEHELLKYKEGRWKMQVEMWVSPDAEPTVSEGTSE